MDLHFAALKNGVLGEDFLTWLWFRSEKNNGTFNLPGLEPFNLSLEKRLSVRGGEGEISETAVVSSPSAQFSEARLGLRRGKRVDQALLCFEQDGNSWEVRIKADDFNFSGLKTPKVEKRLEEGDDPDAPFLEKCFLVERLIGFADALYRYFLSLRLGAKWPEETLAINNWLKEQE